MLDALKRLFARSAPPSRSWDEVARWAASRQASLKPAREDGGFVIEGRFGAVPWRLEWGPSQRPYVEGHELRLRAELPLAGDVQALVLDRMLQASMEKTIFDQYVEGVQTRIDQQTPPEMRWLVMFPKLAPQDLGSLRDRFAAVAPGRTWLMRWFTAGLADALLAAPLTAGQPLVLMVARSRVTLRTALDRPEPDALQAWLKVFDVALRTAPRDIAPGPDSGLPSTQPGLFPAGTDDASRG